MIFPPQSTESPHACASTDRPGQSNKEVTGMHRQVSCDTRWCYVHLSYHGSQQIIFRGSNFQIWYQINGTFFKQTSSNQSYCFYLFRLVQIQKVLIVEPIVRFDFVFLNAARASHLRLGFLRFEAACSFKGPKHGYVQSSVPVKALQ